MSEKRQRVLVSPFLTMKSEHICNMRISVPNSEIERNENNEKNTNPAEETENKGRGGKWPSIDTYNVTGNRICRSQSTGR